MKKFFIVLIMVFGLFALVGCGGNESDSVFVDLTEEVKGSTDEVNIKFRVPSGVISAALPGLIADFNQVYPQIKVELDAVTGGYGEVRKTTILDIQSDKAPTLVLGYPDHFAEYFSAQTIIKLQEYITGPNGYNAEELADFVESYLDEGKNFDLENPNDIYSLPFNKSTEVLIYNKTMFDAMKEIDSAIVVPKTWEELKTVSEKINTLVENGDLDDVITIAEGEKKPSEFYTEGTFYPFAYDSTDNAFITMTRQRNGGYTEKVSNDKGYIVFNSPENLAGLNYFKAENEARRFAVAETFNESYASDAFIALKTFMTVGSSAGIGYNIPEANKFEIAVSEVPYLEANSDNKYVIQQGTNVAILAQSTNKQRAAAWLLLKFLLQPEYTAKFAMATGGYLPVRLSAYETTEYSEYLVNPPIGKEGFSMAANVALGYLDGGYKFFVDPAFVGSSGVRDEVGAIFTAVIVNGKDPQERIEKAYQTLGKAYQKPE
ncbi:MAG: extracellular solute-binding protein [Bacilli bacterium]|jgi:ABC-type glycerol-3-phosphate transport system substrate-binding protein|nr:extracellular solute-binding protein [Bacilli bacterium]MDD4482526.1 extracellular solute-binding protein [Bacilli bacterium]MDY0363652.1 extracellular solute-binding protein [Bacilli bacterium]